MLGQGTDDEGEDEVGHTHRQHVVPNVLDTHGTADVGLYTHKENMIL